MECIYDRNLVQIYQLTPNVYFRKADLARRGQSNGAYLVSGSTVAAVDVPTMEAAHEMMEESERLFGHPIQTVFITHGHEDHVGGLPVFLDQPVTLFCSHRLKEQITPAEKSFMSSIVGVNGKLSLNFAGLDIDLITLAYTAHSPCDLFIHLPKEQILCTGDAAVEFETLYFHEADVENWIASLRALSANPGKWILPGHGHVYPHTHLEDVAFFIETLDRAACHCLERLSPDGIRDMDEQEINAHISGYLSGNDADAFTIRQKAGNDAERELRMVFQCYVKGAFLAKRP